MGLTAWLNKKFPVTVTPRVQTSKYGEAPKQLSNHHQIAQGLEKQAQEHRDKAREIENGVTSGSIPTEQHAEKLKEADEHRVHAASLEKASLNHHAEARAEADRERIAKGFQDAKAQSERERDSKGRFV